MKRHSRSGPGQVRFSTEAAAALDAMTDEQAYANALADPDNPPLPDDRLNRPIVMTAARKARLKSGLSQPAFADAFGFTLGRLRDLEQGRTQPDGATEAYLRLIHADPDMVRGILAEAA